MAHPTPEQQLQANQKFFLQKYLKLTVKEQQVYPQFQQEMEAAKTSKETHTLFTELATRLRNQQNQ